MLSLVPGCRMAVAPTKLMSVTSEAPPDSRGIGCTRKCSSMSKMDWNHRCCTLHWPSSFSERRRCCGEEGNDTCKAYASSRHPNVNQFVKQDGHEILFVIRLISAGMLSSHLGFSLEVESEDVFSAPRLALTDQEDAVARRASSQH